MTDENRFPVRWEALPLRIRLADKLGEALMAASELRAQLDQEEAAPLASLVRELDAVIERFDGALRRLAS